MEVGPLHHARAGDTAGGGRVKEGGRGRARGRRELPAPPSPQFMSSRPNPGPAHPDARGPLRKLGQKLKRGSQIEPYRLSHSFNGLLFTILIHFRSNKANRKQFGGPFLVLVSNFFKKIVLNPIALASGCTAVHWCSASTRSVCSEVKRCQWCHVPVTPGYTAGEYQLH